MTESTQEIKTEIQSGPLDWTDKAKRLVEVVVEAQLHAYFILATGALLAVHGHKDEGLLVLGGAMGIFTGKK
jgi:hypothetical protein